MTGSLVSSNETFTKGFNVPKSLCVVQVTTPSSGNKRRKTKVCLMMCEQRNGNFYPSPAHLRKILETMSPKEQWWIPRHPSELKPFDARADYQVFTFPIKEGALLNAPHYIQVPLEAIMAAWGNPPIKY